MAWPVATKYGWKHMEGLRDDVEGDPQTFDNVFQHLPQNRSGGEGTTGFRRKSSHWVSPKAPLPLIRLLHSSWNVPSCRFLWNKFCLTTSPFCSKALSALWELTQLWRPLGEHSCAGKRKVSQEYSNWCREVLVHQEYSHIENLPLAKEQRSKVLNLSGSIKLVWPD